MAAKRLTDVSKGAHYWVNSASANHLAMNAFFFARFLPKKIKTVHRGFFNDNKNQGDGDFHQST
jgi:hypothetical protein